jgi:hypothetical protein
MSRRNVLSVISINAAGLEDPRYKRVDANEIGELELLLVWRFKLSFINGVRE